MKVARVVVIGFLGADVFHSAGGRLARFEQAARHNGTEEHCRDEEVGEARVAPRVYAEEGSHDAAR